jgi:uncharacterized membrane protein
LSDSEPERKKSDDLVHDGEVLDAQPVSDGPPGPGRHLSLDARQSRYASPLPPADDLERYERLLPGAAERLLAAGEREQAHRHEIENRLAALDEFSAPKFYEGQRRGHFISLTIALTLGVGYELVMAYAIFKGAAVEGVVGAAVGIAALIWAARRDPYEPQDGSEDDGAASGEQPGRSD